MQYQQDKEKIAESATIFKTKKQTQMKIKALTPQNLPHRKSRKLLSQSK
jgi:hypothetical protein